MARLSTLENNRFFIILMGKPFSGKSILASQFPNPWFIDLDFKLGSVNAIKGIMGLDFDFDVTQISEDETTDPDFIQLVGKGFAKQSGWRKVKKFAEVLVRKMPQDSTLIVDGLSRAGEMLKTHLVQLTGHNPLQIQDWGTFFEEMCDFCDALASPDAKPNVILVAHEHGDKDEVTGAIERVLLVSGRSASRLPSLADEFWHLTHSSKRKQGGITESTRMLQSIGDRLTGAGSRSWMPNIVNPTYAKVKPYLEKSVSRTLPAPTWTPKED